jgi:hypothetical protein
MKKIKMIQLINKVETRIEETVLSKKIKTEIAQMLLDVKNEAINYTRCCEELPRWTNNDVDSAYLMGCMNVGGVDEISKELKRLEELGLKPHEAVGKVRGKW